jgi:hypothetical protein
MGNARGARGRATWILGTTLLLCIGVAGGYFGAQASFSSDNPPTKSASTPGLSSTVKTTTTTTEPATSGPVTTTTSSSAPVRTGGTSTSPSTVTVPASTTNVDLPVTQCPTTFGTQPSGAPATPPSSEVSVPNTLVGQLAIYTNSQNTMTVVGPIGWNCGAAYGADGSDDVSMYPPGSSSPTARSFTDSPVQAIVISNTGSCESCTEQQACPLFPAAATDYQTDFQMTCPTTRPSAETVLQIESGLVSFLDPAGVKGDGYPSGGLYPAEGEMTYRTDDATGSWLETCTLVPAQQAVCEVAIKRFTQLYGAN